MTRKALSRAAAVSLLLVSVFCLLISPPALAESKFTDTKGHWAEQAIEEWSVVNGVTILKGYNGLFRPDDGITRAEMAALLNRIVTYPRASLTLTTYPDISNNAWYADDCTRMAYFGVIHLQGGKVYPNEKLSREEAAYMIARAVGMPASGGAASFPDANQFSDWALPYAITMEQEGYIQGFPDGRFDPKGGVTRAQIVTMFDNMFEYFPYNVSNQDSMDYHSILFGGSKLEKHNYDIIFVRPNYSDKEITIHAVPGKTVKIYYVGWTRESLKLVGDTGNSFEVYFTDLHRTSPYFAGGNGSKDDPYLITNQQQLKMLENFASQSTRYFAFSLQNDIKLSGQWEPIKCTSYSVFEGIFDGNGHTISNMNVNVSSENGVSAGLFRGFSQATVRNLTVKGKVVAALPDNAFSTNDPYQPLKYVTLRVGGLAGEARYSTIENCHAEVEIEATNGHNTEAGGLIGYAELSTQVTNCSTNGSVYGQARIGNDATRNAHAGGLIGAVFGAEVSNCTSSAKVSAAGGYYAFAGGLAGAVATSTKNALVESCYATGTVTARDSLMQNNAGGFVGQLSNTATIQQCWSSGQVNVSGNPGYFNAIGGFAGSCYEGGLIENCFTLSQAGSLGSSSWPAYGGFVGRLAGTVRNSYAAGKLVNLQPGEFYGSTRAAGTTENCQLIFTAADYKKSAAWDCSAIWREGATLPLLRDVAEAEQKQAMTAAGF